MPQRAAVVEGGGGPDRDPEQPDHPDGAVQSLRVLTPRQEARRHRVIEAALTLGSEGGYDAVQMRDVASTANVALGTIYRYFSSKDHLLAEAWVDWTQRLVDGLGRRPPRGDTPADQLVDVFRRACRGLERQPKLAAALVQALSSRDQNVARSSARVNSSISEMASPVLADVDPEFREGVIDIVRHVWHSTLLGWANGRRELSHVGDELERTIRLVLRDGR